jgi:hypothetical protein
LKVTVNQNKQAGGIPTTEVAKLESHSLENEGRSRARSVDCNQRLFPNLLARDNKHHSLASQSRVLNSSHSVQITMASAFLQASAADLQMLTWGLIGSAGIAP